MKTLTGWSFGVGLVRWSAWKASISGAKALSVVVNLRVGPMLILGPVTTVLGAGSNQVGAWAVAVLARHNKHAARATCLAWRLCAVGG